MHSIRDGAITSSRRCGSNELVDPETGILTASREQIGALAAWATGAAEADAGAVDAMLGQAGAGSLERPHLKLTEAWRRCAGRSSASGWPRPET